MLTPLPETPESLSISASLTDFLISCTPEKQIGVTTIDTDHLVNGAVSELAAACLTEQEQCQFDTYSFEKRRLQWLVGRVCAKQSVLKLYENIAGAQQLLPSDISIGVAPSGRPFLDALSIEPTHPAPDISISHSGQLVIALAAHGSCGIDIQMLTDTLFKVKSRYCSEQEHTLLDAAVGDELTQLGLLWVAKESVRKCFSNLETIGFLGMEVTAIQQSGSCSLLEMRLDQSCGGVETVTVAASAEEHYCLGACIVPGEAERARAA